MNVQDVFASAEDLGRYLQFWREQCAFFVSTCPICEHRRVGSNPYYVIMRSNMRNITVKCKNCGFMFTVTYRQLKKALERWATEKEKAGYFDDFEARRKMDKLEIRGKGG